MNSNLPFILFIAYSIGYLIVFAITDNILGIVLIAMFSVFGLFINERLNDIEDLLRRYRGN